MAKRKNKKDGRRRKVSPPTTIQESEIRELIRRRRYQILIHSIIYYRFGDNIVSDEVWDMWAIELQQLQDKYPNISKSLKYYKDFKDWSGSSGFYLESLSSPSLVAKAIYLMDIHKGRNNKKRIRLHF